MNLFVTIVTLKLFAIYNHTYYDHKNGNNIRRKFFDCIWSVIWLNILILEDNSYIRQFLKRILPLRYSQIVIFESNTVHEAIQLISEIDFQWH